MYLCSPNLRLVSSKKLNTPEELNAYTSHKAFIRIFKYKPLNQYDHLICVHGDRGQGALGEIAYLIITEDSYNDIAQRYPIAQREAGLFRSDFFEVGEVLELVKVEAPIPAVEN